MNRHILEASEYLDRAARALIAAQVHDGREQIEALDRAVTFARLAAVSGLRAMAELSEPIDPDFAALCRTHPLLGADLAAVLQEPEAVTDLRRRAEEVAR